jgi:hypothetical protein
MAYPKVGDLVRFEYWSSHRRHVVEGVVMGSRKNPRKPAVFSGRWGGYVGCYVQNALNGRQQAVPWTQDDSVVTMTILQEGEGL